MAQSAGPSGGSPSGQSAQAANNTNNKTPGKTSGPSPSHSQAVDRFAAAKQHLAKDDVPLRRGKTMDRQQMLSEFQQRVSSESGRRDKFGFAHTEAVVAQQRELRHHNAAVKRFAPAKSAQPAAPSKSPSPSMGMG